MCISFVSFFPAKFPVTVQLERKRCPNVTTDVFFPFHILFGHQMSTKKMLILTIFVFDNYIFNILNRSISKVKYVES